MNMFLVVLAVLALVGFFVVRSSGKSTPKR